MRLIGFDLIRIVALVAIVVFHATWILWDDPLGPPNPFPTMTWQLVSAYARAFAFSGFIIIGLTSFLSGWHLTLKEKGKRWLPLFLIVGWLIFSALVSVKEQRDFRLVWDIYPLLVLGLFTGQYLLFSTRSNYVGTLISGVLLLCIPVESFSPFTKGLPFWVGEVLFGQCPEDFADWPVFPWLGLIWVSMGGGKWAAETYALSDKNLNVFKMQNWEPFVWIPIVVGFGLNAGAYFHTPLGDGWACHTFRQSPLVFWSHFMFWALMLRLSLEPRVQSFLEVRFTWVSKLYISRYFFLAYFFHFVSTFALRGLLNPYQSEGNEWANDVIVLSVLPLTEIWLRYSIRLIRFQVPFQNLDKKRTL